MNNKMVGNKPLYVALAQRKEDRKARLQVRTSVSEIVFYMTDVPDIYACIVFAHLVFQQNLLR